MYSGVCIDACMKYNNINNIIFAFSGGLFGFVSFCTRYSKYMLSCTFIGKVLS